MTPNSSFTNRRFRFYFANIDNPKCSNLTQFTHLPVILINKQLAKKRQKSPWNTKALISVKGLLLILSCYHELVHERHPLGPESIGPSVTSPEFLFCGHFFGLDSVSAPCCRTGVGDAFFSTAWVQGFLLSWICSECCSWVCFHMCFYHSNSI